MVAKKKVVKKGKPASKPKVKPQVVNLDLTDVASVAGDMCRGKPLTNVRGYEITHMGDLPYNIYSPALILLDINGLVFDREFFKKYTIRPVTISTKNPYNGTSAIHLGYTGLFTGGYDSGYYDFPPMDIDVDDLTQYPVESRPIARMLHWMMSDVMDILTSSDDETPPHIIIPKPVGIVTYDTDRFVDMQKRLQVMTTCHPIEFHESVYFADLSRFVSANGTHEDQLSEFKARYLAGNGEGEVIMAAIHPSEDTMLVFTRPNNQVVTSLIRHQGADVARAMAQFIGKLTATTEWTTKEADSLFSSLQYTAMAINNLNGMTDFISRYITSEKDRSEFMKSFISHALETYSESKTSAAAKLALGKGFHGDITSILDRLEKQLDEMDELDQTVSVRSLARILSELPAMADKDGHVKPEAILSLLSMAESEITTETFQSNTEEANVSAKVKDADPHKSVSAASLLKPKTGHYSIRDIVMAAEHTFKPPWED